MHNCRVLCLFAISLGVAGHQQAWGQAAVFSNGTPSHLLGANNIAYFIGAEDFTLSSTATIRSVRVWVYGLGSSGSIHWTIYSNLSGQPGSALSTGTSTAVPTFTGFVNSDGIKEYTVDFDIAPFTASAGTTYWLGIQDAIADPTDFPPIIPPFNWEWIAPNGSLTSYFYGYGCCGAPTGWYPLNYSPTGDNRGAEHAFELYAGTPAIDVSSLVRVTQNGFQRNRSTGLWVATINVTNTSTLPITGPVQVLLTDLSANATMVNDSGFSSSSPFITVSTGDLAAGASNSVQITFTNSTNGIISYTPITYSGVLR